MDVDGLRSTIDSVKPLLACSNDIEHIVIDGGSTDGTFEFLQSCQQIEFWVSEPDGGACDALNKGLKSARGRYSWFLNSGDLVGPNFTPEVCARLLEDLRCGPDRLISCGVVNSDLKKIHMPAQSSASMRMKSMLHHQGTLYPTHQLIAAGGYNNEFGMRGDLELNLRILKMFDPIIESRRQITISEFRGGGMTSSFSGSLKFHRLGWLAFKAHGEELWWDRFWRTRGVLKILKRAARKLLNASK